MFFTVKTGEKVLVIGGGTSGTDLVGLLSNVASHISLSVRKPTNQANEEQSRRDLPKMVKLKHNVKHFTANGAVFIDGTYQNFTRVIYATGNINNIHFIELKRKLTMAFPFIQATIFHIHS